MLALTDEPKLTANPTKLIVAPSAAVPMNEAELITSCLLEPKTIAETLISASMIGDLVLKFLYYTSYLNGYELAMQLRLSFHGVLNVVILSLRREELIEVTGANGVGDAGYQYQNTDKGMARAEAALRRSGYLGPAPVPLAKYIELVLTQARYKPSIDRASVSQALQGMTLTSDLIDQVGAVVSNGRSLFLFGSPGNGKSMLAERIAAMLGDTIAIPYAIEADGQIIQFFDLNLHHPVAFSKSKEMPANGGSSLTSLRPAEYPDHRWIQIKRPVVMVGGELVMESLDLRYHTETSIYEAPFQLKANNGVFLIDDFGRQQMRPQQLLNRWIVPLEKRVDFLTLHTGKKLLVPFELFLVLSTNLEPADLVDEAFLRRIQNKLYMPNPTLEQFCQIFVSECQRQGVVFDEAGLKYLIDEYYMKTQRPPRSVHPRDLLRQLVGFAQYHKMPPQLIPRLIDQAASTYFGPLKTL